MKWLVKLHNNFFYTIIIYIFIADHILTTNVLEEKKYTTKHVDLLQIRQVE